MRKFIYFLFVVFITNIGLSQENVYIIINKHPDIQHFAYRSDTIQHDQYHITLSPEINKIEFSIKNNKLHKYSEMRAYNRTSFDFTYQNINGNNNPILVKKDSLQNKITYEEMILAKDYRNLLEILRRFKNVYLIDEASFFDGYYIAKKIEKPSFLAQL